MSLSSLPQKPVSAFLEPSKSLSASTSPLSTSPATKVELLESVFVLVEPVVPLEEAIPVSLLEAVELEVAGCFVGGIMAVSSCIASI